ncbi:hypothetical protein LguiB_009662 [Lonicera macranthoides]
MMMQSKDESWRSRSEDSSSGRLLHDIEEISKALYLQKKPPKALISPSDYRSKSAGKTRPGDLKSNYVGEDLLQKEKKSSSIWNWKPLKALTHIRNHRVNCCFFLRVHSIKGLPSNFNDLGLYVHWKRKDELLQTCPARVSEEGVAEFEETLMHRCSIYASKSGSQNSRKYEPKLFLLYASVVGASGLDIGKHWIDLTRLLPHTFEKLEEDKRSSGKWTTSFKLTGKAKGAILNVSFGFSSLGDNSFQSRSSVKVPDLLKVSEPSSTDQFGDFCRTSGGGGSGGGGSDSGRLRRLGSVPSNSNHGSHLPSRSLDIKVLNDVFPNRGSELTQSITFLYKKLDEGHFGDLEDFNFYYEHLEPHKPPDGSSLESGGESSGNESNDTEFTVIEQGIEYSMNDTVKLEDVVDSVNGSEIEIIDVAEIFKGDEEMESNSKGNLKDDYEVDGENSVCTQESTIEEVESIFHDLSISESALLESSIDKKKFLEQESYVETELSNKRGKMARSLSFDDVTESVTNEFLNLLGFKQSQLDMGFNSEPDSPRERLLRQFEKDYIASGNPIFNFEEAEPVEMEFTGAASTSYTFGDCTEDFDLSLMIQSAEKESDRVSQSLRSRRDAKILENLETEALMQQWGLNEKAFQYSPRMSSGGFGSPVYVYPEEPPELPLLGEGLGPIVQTKGGGFLRSMSPSLFKNAKNGESLIMQVSCPIVLPKAMGSSGIEILQCWALVGIEKMSMQVNDLMPLDDITGKTIQQVALEALSGFEEIKRKFEKGPPGQSSYDPNSQSLGDEVDSGCVFLQDLAPLAMDKIASLSIEGLRIQSGFVDEEAPSVIRLQPTGSSSLTKSINFSGASDIDELISLTTSLNEWMKLNSETVVDKGENCGSLGENLTIALKVQLRDPFRDYESVGASMLALIQVERIFMPLKSDVYNTKSERSHNGEDKENSRFEEFKICEIHVAGLNCKPGKKQLWGTRTHQQSGCRWLQSSGLGKINKNSLLKSSAIVRSSSRMMRKLKPEDKLWSISSHVHSEGDKWKELSVLNLHERNPDIVFPDETIRLSLEFQ